MATQEKTWNVANRLHSLKDSDNPELNHIIAGADEIYDDAKGAKQSDINTQTDAALADRYTKAETYSKEQLDSLITTPDANYVTVATFAGLPQTGEANTIYRVSSYDGTQVDASKYALYAWNGTTYQLLAVRSAVGEVFDVSEYNSDATYETLAAALAAVPESVQRGGMSIKFILRTNTGTEEEPVYHDEYVQYRLMSTDWSTVITDWQGVDKVPTPGSHNFVESGGVQNELALGAIYDVSAKNPTAGPNNDGKFESLSSLLSDNNLDILIPTSVRRGGMSIKFIQSSDNKYVQFRYMPANATTAVFFTNVANWQGVDDEPTAGSQNLIKSDGVDTMNANCRVVDFNFTTNVNSITRYVQVEKGHSYDIKITNDTTVATGLKCVINLYKSDGTLEKTLLSVDWNKSLSGLQYKIYTTDTSAYISVRIDGSVGEKTSVIIENEVLKNLIPTYEFDFKQTSSITKIINIQPSQKYSLAFSKNTDYVDDYKLIVNAYKIDGTLIGTLYSSGTQSIDLTNKVIFETSALTYTIRIALKGTTGEKTTAFVEKYDETDVVKDNVSLNVVIPGEDFTYKFPLVKGADYVLRFAKNIISDGLRFWINAYDASNNLIGTIIQNNDDSDLSKMAFCHNFFGHVSQFRFQLHASVPVVLPGMYRGIRECLG